MNAESTPVSAEAQWKSYYGRPVIKPPVWEVPDVPAYLYLGGMAGASATIALASTCSGRPRLARTARIASTCGSTASVVALVHDLGRPARFLNMLRVIKPTSPLSIGSWILAPFSALAAVGTGSAVTGWFPLLGRLSSAAAGVLGPAMTTYTAVLLSDTAVPAWHEAYRELPFVFAGSAVASAGALGVLTAPVREAAPARRMAVAGTALELLADARMRRREGVVGEAFRKGRPGTLLRVSRALSLLGAGAALASGRSRIAAVSAGLCLTAAAATTRFGIFEAGMESARDPRYTVAQQRRDTRADPGR